MPGDQPNSSSLIRLRARQLRSEIVLNNEIIAAYQRHLRCLLLTLRELEREGIMMEMNDIPPDLRPPPLRRQTNTIFPNRTREPLRDITNQLYGFNDMEHNET